MSKRETYESRTEELLEPIVKEVGVEIYDIEYVKEGSDFYLRVYIDKAEGVNIIECEAVSRALSEAMDVHDFIPDAYILEVSSPGLGRTLKKDKHLEKSIGKEIEIKLFKQIDKSKDYKGILISFDKEDLVIEEIKELPKKNKKKQVEEPQTEGQKLRTFKRTDIALIRLALDF